LKKGENTLAVYGVVRYEKDKKTSDYHRVGHIDLWFEGLKTAELEIEQ